MISERNCAQDGDFSNYLKKIILGTNEIIRS